MIYCWALFRLSNLEETQDHMEFIEKFVGIGPHGVHHMAYAGEIVGHAGELGSVAEDAHTAPASLPSS